jgi:integrase
VALVYRTHTAFRHGYVHRLSRAGVPTDLIAKVVGHRSARTTERYNLRRLGPAELARLINLAPPE